MTPLFARIALLPLIVVSVSRVSLGEPPTPPPSANAREIVQQWLELHRSEKEEKAAALTTRSYYIRTPKVLPSDMPFSLGNQHSAAVVSGPLEKGSKDPLVLVCWLVRPKSTWQIHKAQTLSRSIVNQQLRGYLEAGDVHWNVSPTDLHGDWSAGPCKPPWFPTTACGSSIKLAKDSCQLLAWGPGGPHPDEGAKTEPKPSWRIWNGNLILTEEDNNTKHIVRIAWWDGEHLELETLDSEGYGTATTEYLRDEF